MSDNTINWFDKTTQNLNFPIILTIIWIINFTFIWKISSLISSYQNGLNTEFLTYFISQTNNIYCVFYLIGAISLCFSLFFPSKNIIKYQDIIFNAPITVPILNVSALLIGIYTSVTSTNILNWLTNENKETLSSYAGFDYCLFSLVILLIGYGMNGQANKRDNQQSEAIQKERLKQLEEVIRLAPPGAFAEQLSHYCDILEDWSSNHVMQQTNNIAFEDITEEIREKYISVIKEQRGYIRACLTAFARLTGTYDNASMNLSSPDIYRANIMLKLNDNCIDFLSNEYELTNADREFKSRYFPKINTLPNYKLILDKKYSIKVLNSDKAILKNELAEQDYHLPQEFDFDSDIKNLILPVFISNPHTHDYNYDEKEEFDYKTYNLIGAPQAIATGQPQFVFDAEQQSKEWLSDGAPKALYEQACQYFRNDKKGQSIISLPLLSNRYGTMALHSDNISGAINIYRNTKNMFSGDKEKFSNFFHLTSPALVSLARVVEYHIILLNKLAEYDKVQKQNGEN